MTNCPICNGTLKHSIQPVTYKYKKNIQQINQVGNYCSSCNESFLSPKDLKTTQKEIFNLLK